MPDFELNLQNQQLYFYLIISFHTVRIDDQLVGSSYRNPFMPNGFFYLKVLDRSICNRSDVGFLFIIIFVIIPFYHFIDITVLNANSADRPFNRALGINE